MADRNASLIGVALFFLFVGLALPGTIRAQEKQAPDDEFASFVEPNFPFITTTASAHNLAPWMPERNISVRGVAIQLGNDAYAVFDPDLLRMAVGWKGKFLSMGTMAQVSYSDAYNKSNKIPQVLGEPVVGTGIYPGWMGKTPRFEDPRPALPNPDDVGRGPLAAERGRWKGLYTVGQHVVLSYRARGTDIHEQPGSVTVGDEVGISRTFEIGKVRRPLTLVAGEVDAAAESSVDENQALVVHGADRDSVTAAGVVDAPEGAQLRVIRDRYLTLQLPEGTSASQFRVVVWTGPRAKLNRFQQMLDEPVEMVDYKEGNAEEYWSRTVTTQGKVAPDTSTYVVDQLALPLPNPWKRNVRAADIEFFEDGRAALVTFAGDVWIASGIDQSLDRLQWKRYASGLYEPLSLSIVDGAIYVYGREGIVRLRDLNDDNEADYYENFSNLIIQSTESREWPLSMAAKPGGGFYVSVGGALNAGPKTSEPIVKGFRLGSPHSGAVVEVSADGKSVQLYATGFREPFLGIHPETGFLTASDQQGNFVPSTPIFHIRKGGFYGVPPTAHLPAPLPDSVPPITWIPHEVDQSGTEQVWITSDQMGPLSGKMVHLSYGRPGLFRVYMDTVRSVLQGGVAALPGRYPVPALGGQVRPQDGQLYVAGFQVFGSQAEPVTSVLRVRYTGGPDPLPADLKAGRQGIIVRFNRKLDREAATQAANYQVQRWKYKRSKEYGSGYFKPDGSSGQEQMPVAAAHLSSDQKAVLLVLPDMQNVMQMGVDYALEDMQGRPLEKSLYLTVNALQPFDLPAAGFESVDWQRDVQLLAQAGSEEAPSEEEAASSPVASASANKGQHLFQEIGCVGCHTTDGTQQGLGPTFKGLYGSTVELEGGSTVEADEDYLEQSILNPASQIVHGYEEGMPSYSGILDESEVKSLILFIESLSDERASAAGQKP